MKLNAKWIWAAEEYANAYCYMRRQFMVADVAYQATFRIAAQSLTVLPHNQYTGSVQCRWRRVDISGL